MRRTHGPLLTLVLLVPLLAAAVRPQAAASGQDPSLDARVRGFLDSHRDLWREENITESDGRVLYDLIVKKGYKRALEIGTSTGRSGIWEAWALSKTGGSLVTIEIEEFRHLAAVRNFKAAGLDGLIDARLGDARQIVAQLPGPFDFIFVDADKNATPYYFETLLPKLEVGGCFAVHNVTSLGYMKGIRDFLQTVRGLDSMETSIESAASGGISLSFKKKMPS
jgi:caffeoyl-CoA O-methyltransferase